MTIVGLTLNLLGALLLAFAQARLFSTIGLWLMAHETSLLSLLSGGNVIHPIGPDEHWDKANAINRSLSLIGWILIAAGYLLQIIPLGLAEL
jgi:uncharacterized membrane protein (DUF2068 family)